MVKYEKIIQKNKTLIEMRNNDMELLSESDSDRSDVSDNAQFLPHSVFRIISRLESAYAISSMDNENQYLSSEASFDDSDFQNDSET